MNHLRAVVWYRGVDDDARDADGRKVHRYAITGMLVTAEPIASLEGNEHVIDGPVPFIEELLDRASKREAKIPVGDATDVLLSLKEI